MSVHPRAARGFGSAAAAYELGRPSWPAELVGEAARRLGVGPGSTVLDLAAGTGKLTRVLVALADRVVAVEPSPGMLAALRAALPQVDAREGSAEAVPLPDASVDAAFVGEAFHWFATEPAARELARVLRPRGGLALLWNREARPDPEEPWRVALDAVITPLRERAGAWPGADWRPALERLGLFAPLERLEAAHVQTLAPDGLVALVASFSWIAGLPDQERARVLATVRERLPPGPVALPYRAEAWVTRRAG